MRDRASRGVRQGCQLVDAARHRVDHDDRSGGHSLAVQVCGRGAGQPGDRSSESASTAAPDRGHQPMTFTAGAVAELRKAAAELPQYGGEDLSALTTTAELAAYVVALCRHHDIPEDDGIELFARAARYSRDDLKGIER